MASPKENGQFCQHPETVIVTGFGPFRHHAINPSYEAVRLLPNLNLEEELGIQLVTAQIPVIYQTVQETIPKLWAAYNPKLVVHVGVGSVCDRIQLEARGYNNGYCGLDVHGCLPIDGCCKSGSPNYIDTGVDVRKICEELNDCFGDAVSCVSNDAGRYLCDFTYYTSLEIDSSRTVFIHVPELDKPFSALELAKLLKMAITYMLKEVRGKDKTINI